MRHFPIFLDMRHAHVAVAGVGETALAKLRLLVKSEARISVFGHGAIPTIAQFAAEGRVTLIERAMTPADATGVRVIYAAHDDDPRADERVVTLGRTAGVLVNSVDNLENSDFLTPALVDRAPVTVAIGTEGTAPVLARRIKADLEERLPQNLGTLARVASSFRGAVAQLTSGRARRSFWTRYFDDFGARTLKEDGESALLPVLEEALQSALAGDHQQAEASGMVHFVGAGPGDPELLTLKARRLLHEADVVIHDRLVPLPVLELARREATIIEVGKIPHGPSWSQSAINDLIVEHALNGAQVVRLKSGDPAIFGRLDEEMDALDTAHIAFNITPGITSAAAAAASINASMTRRHRNTSLRLLTGHDINGFADHDWRALSQQGAIAAIYMGVRAARYIQSRLLMHGGAPDTPMAIVENASRPEERRVSTTLADLEQAIHREGIKGPAIVFLGIAPRADAVESLSILTAEVS